MSLAISPDENHEWSSDYPPLVLPVFLIPFLPIIKIATKKRNSYYLGHWKIEVLKNNGFIDNVLLALYFLKSFREYLTIL